MKNAIRSDDEFFESINKNVIESQGDTFKNMQQTISQLRANAKGHKKTVDKLSAKVSQLTQWRDDAAAQLSLKEQEAAFYKTELEMRGYKTFKVGGLNACSLPYVKREETKWSTLGMAAIASVLFGFLASVGGICAYGWFMALSSWL